MKVCSKCKIEKPILSFSIVNKNGKPRPYSSCRECVNLYEKERRKRPKRIADQIKSHFKRRYKITEDDYNYMLSEQQNKCKICLKPPTEKRQTRLCVDHDHKTNKIRGLLCGKCNKALGLFNDDMEIIQKAYNYLKSML